MIDFAAKRGCPVCIRGWKMIAVAGTVAVVVALLMLRWHAGGHPDDGAVIAPVPVAPKGPADHTQRHETPGSLDA